MSSKEFIAFISGADSDGDRDLVTLLFTDVVDSTRAVVAAGDDEWRQTLNFLDDLVAARVGRAGGRIVKQTGDGHLIEFARPGDAVDAAIAICRAAPTLGVTLRAGIHTGEIERRENGDIGGLTVHIAARVAAVRRARAKSSSHGPLPISSVPPSMRSETTANTNSKASPVDGHSSLSTLERDHAGVLHTAWPCNSAAQRLRRPGSCTVQTRPEGTQECRNVTR